MILKPITPFEPKKSNTIPSESSWLAQIKWDGVRILTYFDGNHVQLFNRKKRERTDHYPELTNLSSYCSAQSIILDGEVIALGEDGKPSFHEVMRRDSIRRMEKVKIMCKKIPISYMIFDILYLNGQWVNRRPLSERIVLLADIIRPNDQIQLVSSHHDGKALFDIMQKQGMEGIIVKKKEAPYLLGEKKDYWMKIKNYLDAHALVGGFTLKDDIINALLLGIYDGNGQLRYVGHAGTGKLTHADWRHLTEQLQPTVIAKSPFTNQPQRLGNVHWVQPSVTVKVQFVEWTKGGSMRQPSIQSLMEDSSFVR